MTIDTAQGSHEAAVGAAAATTTGPDGGATPWRRVAGIVVGVAALLTLVATAFAWPVVNSGPRDVPLAVAAPAPVAEALTQQLATVAGEDAFAVSVVADRAAAQEAVLDREVYGAIVVGGEGGEVLTASGASPAIAQLLAQIATNAPEQAGGPFPVTDLAPLPEDDPRGSGLGSAVLPLVIAGIASGAASGLAVSGRGRQLVTMTGVAVVGGLVLVGVVQAWLGGLPGSYWANAGVLSLGIAAVGAVALGLVRLLGAPGIALTALVMVLLGSTLSGAQSAPEMLPSGWGTFGQLLPPGAAGTALRSVAWFDGAGSGSAFLVLACWVVAGLALTMLPSRRAAHRA